MNLAKLGQNIVHLARFKKYKITQIYMSVGVIPYYLKDIFCRFGTRSRLADTYL
jgi:hypothetical protein